jgi:hypothetical protein
MRDCNSKDRQIDKQWSTTVGVALGLQSLIIPTVVDHCLSVCLALGLQSLIIPTVVDHCLSV